MSRQKVSIDPSKLLGFRLESRPSAKCGTKAGVKAGFKPQDFTKARAMLGGKPVVQGAPK
jgi:hypothetical protein